MSEQPIFQKIPLKNIKVRGEIGRRMAITAGKILDHLDIENEFARHFKNRLEKPDVYGGFVGYGMLLDAIVKAVASGVGGERLRALKERLLCELAGTQAVDGSISIFKVKPEGWDNHEQAYIIISMVNDYVLHGNRHSLETAVRLGRYMLEKKTTANIGVEQALLMLYEHSGEKSFLDYCLNDLRLTSNFRSYDQILLLNGLCHVYTFMARAYAQLELGRITHDYSDSVLTGARELFRRILSGGYASITGSCTGGRYWGEVWNKSQLGLGHWGETCAAAYLLRNSCAMLELEGKSIYGDLSERVMYNALFAAQTPDGLRQRYYVPFNESGEWYENETYCCPNNFRRIIFELPQAVYMKCTDGIVVNLYEDSSLSTEIRGNPVTIVQKTEYPDSEQVMLEVKTLLPLEFTILFRVPGWCSRFTVTVGEEKFSGRPGSFMQLRLVWNDGDCLKIDLPAEVRFIRGYAAQQEKFAMMRGPVVYGIDPSLNKLAAWELDTLAFRLSCPPEKSADGIKQHCVRGSDFFPTEKDVLFTRFSAPGREFVYLPTHDAGYPVSDDEILIRENKQNK